MRLPLCSLHALELVCKGAHSARQPEIAQTIFVQLCMFRWVVVHTNCTPVQQLLLHDWQHMERNHSVPLTADGLLPVYGTRLYLILEA